MRFTANFGSFFGQPVSNTRTPFAPTGFNMPAAEAGPVEPAAGVWAGRMLVNAAALTVMVMVFTLGRLARSTF